MTTASPRSARLDAEIPDDERHLEFAARHFADPAVFPRDQVDGNAVVEVGWSITPHRRRQGFAAEAARASISWGFEACGLDEIVSFTTPHNHASRAVMAAVGMSFVDEFDRAGLPHVLYRVKKPERTYETAT